MWLKITQLVKEWLSRIRNVRSLSAIDITLLRPFLILLAITLLSYETIDLFYKIISFSLTKQTAFVRSHVSSPVVTDNKKPASVEDYGIIIERNLFHSTLKAVKDKELEGGVFASEKVTDFDLKGTVVGNSSFGFIFIEERRSKKQKLYRLGDMIGSAKLIKITRNMAILRSGDREITLKVKVTIENKLFPDSNSRNVTLSKERVIKKLANLSEIMKQAIVRPLMNKGGLEGFIISNIVYGSLYEKMGLRNGDIIIDINDKKIKGVSSLLQAVNLMQTGKNISLNIKRNNNQETINYTFE
jgi:general secretion pathway protein C